MQEHRKQQHCPQHEVRELYIGLRFSDHYNKLHAHAGSELGHETPPITMPTTELTDAPTLPAGEYTSSYNYKAFI